MQVEKVKCDQCGKEHPKQPGLLGEHGLIELSIPPSKMSKKVVRSHYDFCDRACMMRFIHEHYAE